MIKFTIAGLTFTLAALAVAQTPATPTQQRYFESPSAAVDAFIAACRDNNTDELVNIFGPLYKKEEVRIDSEEETANRTKIACMAQEIKRMEQYSPEKFTLLLGTELWPFPIPIVKESNGWRFATEEGFDEILKRRIGKNELNTIDVCKTYIEAQEEYATEDRDDDDILEYAQKIRSTPGTMDGLFWEAGNDKPISPLGPFLAEVDVSTLKERPQQGYMGYRYKILTAQGRHAPGGKESYIENGNMTRGFALVAWPIDYGHSGVMTFMTNHLGAVYQKDLGPKSAQKAEKIKDFNPHDSWKWLETK